MRLLYACYCDSPVCDKNPICKLLGEARIAWRLAKDFKDNFKGIEPSLKAFMDYIEMECEILYK